MSICGSGSRRACLASPAPWIVCALLLLGMAPAHSALQLKGWLEWLHRVEMRVVENGVVEEVTVNAGQQVKQGDLLLRMDQREVEGPSRQVKAEISTVGDRHREAKRELDRAQGFSTEVSSPRRS